MRRAVSLSADHLNMSIIMATHLISRLCDNTISADTTTTTSDLDILDLSPDLFKIRAIYLDNTHIQQLAPRWRSCSCCYEPLKGQAVQMGCCDTIFHRQCLQDFARQKAGTYDERGDRSATISCPWCRTTLECRPADIWAILQQDNVDTVLEVGKHLDEFLKELSKLDSIARVKFMNLVKDYEEMSGELVRAVRLPAKVSAARRSCLGSPEALKAFDLLYKERQSSFDALLEWREWLVYDDDLENQTDLVDADTMYGHGPDKFMPRIVERLRKEE